MPARVWMEEVTTSSASRAWSTMCSVPAFLQHGVRQAFILSLCAWREAYARGTAM